MEMLVESNLQNEQFSVEELAESVAMSRSLASKAKGSYRAIRKSVYQGVQATKSPRKRD
jgi:predicted transcriptional regulator